MHKKIINRVLSSALISILLSSNIIFSNANLIIPLAYADDVNSLTETVDESQNQNSSISKYEQKSSYTVTIPKNITLQDSSIDKTSNYTINVKGDILGTETVSVIPDDSFRYAR